MNGSEWRWCSHCHKEVQPKLDQILMECCPECGSRLSIAVFRVTWPFVLLTNAIMASMFLILLPRNMVVSNVAILFMLLLVWNSYVGTALYISRIYRGCRSCYLNDLDEMIFEDGAVIERITGGRPAVCTPCKYNVPHRDMWHLREQPEEKLWRKLREWWST